jgi:mono/diheme cytochrome c family protein
MTTPSQTPQKNAMREYLIVALIIIVGTPITIWWGNKDGKELAAKAFSEDTTAAAEEAQGVEGGEAEASSDVPETTPESVARGEAVFKAQCVACHGEKADGKGPAAVAFTPGPRDFTDPAAKWTVGREPAQIHETVSNGIAGTGMAGFASALTAEQLWDVVHYLGSLPGVANAQ